MAQLRLAKVAQKIGLVLDRVWCHRQTHGGCVVASAEDDACAAAAAVEMSAASAAALGPNEAGIVPRGNAIKPPAMLPLQILIERAKLDPVISHRDR